MAAVDNLWPMLCRHHQSKGLSLLPASLRQDSCPSSDRSALWRLGRCVTMWCRFIQLADSSALLSMQH